MYIEPHLKIADLYTEEILAHSSDWIDAKEFKDDDLWNEEVTSEGAQKSNLWDKEW